MQETDEFAVATMSRPLSESAGVLLPDEVQFQRDIEAINRFQQIVHEKLVKGQDYGIIPGTTKPALLKAGAEKIAKLLSLCDHYVLLDKLEDWDLIRPLFYYRFQCSLVTLDGHIITQGEGSCNSREQKYRWREGERKCPVCQGKGTIIKGKEQFGGGWLCWKKKGGCGEKFLGNDQRITSQTVEKVENDDIFSLVNTILKMAKKRALVDAALSVGRLSGLFTQDLEDMPRVQNGDGDEAPKESYTPDKKTKAESLVTRKMLDELCTLTDCKDYGDLLLKAIERFDPNASFGLVDVKQIRKSKAQEWIDELDATEMDSREESIGQDSQHPDE